MYVAIQVLKCTLSIIMIMKKIKMTTTSEQSKTPFSKKMTNINGNDHPRFFMNYCHGSSSHAMRTDKRNTTIYNKQKKLSNNRICVAN